MKKLKEIIVAIIAGAGVAIVGFVTLAISVTIIPLISLLIGYWIGFVTEWLANDWLLIDNVAPLMATVFFIVSSVTMLIKTNVKETQK